MLQLQQVSFSFKNKTLIDDVSLFLEKGKAYLLTGHNGSGKTMLLRILAKLIKPTSGKILFHQKPYYGVIIETPSFLMNETAFFNLKFLPDINSKIGKETIIEIMKKYGLYEHRHKRVKTFSLGMRQRLALCQALMEDPNILLLDEPFNALDQYYRSLFLKDLLSEKRKGKTIVIASHGNEGLDTLLFDEVIQIGHGKLEHSSLEKINTTYM